jgi:hypothetical protein
MKKIIITCASLVSLSALAQKTDKTNIDYEMDMYPVELISKEKKFDVIVDYEYRSKAQASSEETAAKKEQAAKDKAEYDKKNYGEKLLATKVMGEAKPTGVYYNNTFVPTLFPEEAVKGQINIPGYMKAPGSKGTVTVLFAELTYTVDPSKTKINYKPLGVTLTIVNDKGETVHSGGIPGGFGTLTTNSVTPADLEKSMVSTLKGAEMNAKNQSVENINTYLKNNYGFNKVKKDRSFFDVKDKKQSYPECHEAIEKVKNAFVYVNMPAKQDVMVAKLKEAIAIWEKDLTELDKNNKDARINKDVAAALYLNIAEACIWTKEFDKAYEALASHKALDEDYSRTYKDISEFLKDYSARYNKYTQY